MRLTAILAFGWWTQTLRCGSLAPRRSCGLLSVCKPRFLSTKRVLAATQGPYCVLQASVVEPPDAFEECWSSTSFSINPSEESPEINQVLQALNSPAPQSLYVLQRALARTTMWKQAFDACYHLIKFEYQIVVRRDASLRCQQTGVDWKAVPVESLVNQTQWTIVERPEDYQSTIQLVSCALKLVEDASERREAVDEARVAYFVQRARQHLDLTLGTDIRGRTCADTAFNLALVGVTDRDLYEKLTKITRLELERVASRPSRRGKDILQIVEKLAASGVRGGEAEVVYRLAAKCLGEKGHFLDVQNDLTTPKRFTLLSERPLLWLWRYSARLAKPSLQRAEDGSANNNVSRSNSQSTAWFGSFEDTQRPLVIDLGCGLGASLLGLASQPDGGLPGPLLVGSATWSDYNYVGGDLNPLTIRFAKGIATRWGLTDRLQYTVAATDCLLDEAFTNYPGRVTLILVQYPSPFRIDDDNVSIGNTQLPGSIESGFMITRSVMHKIATILQANVGARVLFQSNCEDVAIQLRDMATAEGLRCVPAPCPVRHITISNSNNNSTRFCWPQRTKKWIQQGGERPIGPEWWSKSLLPPNCISETEVACGLKGRPVHRCLLEATTGQVF